MPHYTAWLRLTAIVAMASILGACEYVKILRPNVLAEVDPEMAVVINELPNLDEPNEDLIGRLYATGGAMRAKIGPDGIMRTRMRIPKDEMLFYPSIVTLPRGGTLELDVTNEDQQDHGIYLASNGERQVTMLPAGTRGLVRATLDQPGLYWFGCPVANHAGSGMLGFVFVKGEVPPEARLDRPPQPQAGERRPPRAYRH
jgi:PQQ system protein